jgi:hypothetical protein
MRLKHAGIVPYLCDEEYPVVGERRGEGLVCALCQFSRIVRVTMILPWTQVLEVLEAVRTAIEAKEGDWKFDD